MPASANGSVTVIVQNCVNYSQISQGYQAYLTVTIETCAPLQITVVFDTKGKHLETTHSVFLSLQHHGA